MNSKRIKRLLCSIIGILIITLATPFVLWQAKPSQNLKVVIIDKTVTDSTYREHKGFMWILNHLKIKNESENTFFQYDKDYYGFFPLSNERYQIKELPDKLNKPDLIYLTDTYGVYQEDFHKENIHGDRSEIIYGGTTEKEIGTIKNALQGNTIIGEFNTLASPTDLKAKSELEELFGLTWNGWIGRYFADLSKDNMEVPNWMKENYAMQYGEKWNFDGAGIVLVSNDETVIVLREGIELGERTNEIIFTEKAENEFNVKNNSNYYYWFEIIDADISAETLANYRIDVTEKGKSILEQYQLPHEFPAIVRTQGDYTSYYFAGDFADSNSTPGVYCASGIRFFNIITTFDEDTNQNYFYWNVYYPLIEKIVANIN